MKLKPTTYDVGDRVTVKGPRPGVIREMTINEIVVRVTGKGKQSVKYGFKESLWMYSESMIDTEKKAKRTARPVQTNMFDDGLF